MFCSAIEDKSKRNGQTDWQRITTHTLMQASVFSEIAKMSFCRYFSKSEDNVDAVESEHAGKKELLVAIKRSPLVGCAFWLYPRTTYPLYAFSFDTLPEQLQRIKCLLGKDPRIASCFTGTFGQYSHETLLSVCVRNKNIPMSFNVELFELGSRIHPLVYANIMTLHNPKTRKAVKDLEAMIVARARGREERYLKSLSEPRIAEQRCWVVDTYDIPRHLSRWIVK